MSNIEISNTETEYTSDTDTDTDSDNSICFCDCKNDINGEFKHFLDNINRKYGTNFIYKNIVKSFPHTIAQFDYFSETPIELRMYMPIRTLAMELTNVEREYFLDNWDIILLVSYRVDSDEYININIVSR